MSEQKLIEVAKWLNSKGYYIEFEIDELWMEDELTEHRFRDLCELLDEYANERILSVAREAVEEEKQNYNRYKLTRGSDTDLIDYAANIALSDILSRIESKL